MIINNTLPDKKVNLIIIFILALYPLVGMGIDLIAPSLPAISENLHISESVAKSLIPLYLVPYTIASFITGIFSDIWGRRKFMLIAILLFTFASLIPIVFPSIYALILGRILQGAGLGAIPTLVRTIFSDLLPPEKLKTKITWIATMWGIGPIIGPFIGSYLQYYFDWHAGFFFFFIYGLIGFSVLFFILPETHQDRKPLKTAIIMKNFAEILRSNIFLGSVFILGLSYSLLIVFNTVGPFLIQNIFGKSVVFYGRISLMMGICFIVSTFFSRTLLKRYSCEVILCTGIVFFLFISLIMVIMSLLHVNNLTIVIISSLFMFTCFGILFPTGIAKTSSLFRNIAGSSNALIGLINMLITSIAGVIMSFVHTSSALPLALAYGFLLCCCFLSYLLLAYKK